MMTTIQFSTKMHPSKARAAISHEFHLSLNMCIVTVPCTFSLFRYDFILFSRLKSQFILNVISSPILYLFNSQHDKVLIQSIITRRNKIKLSFTISSERNHSIYVPIFIATFYHNYLWHHEIFEWNSKLPKMLYSQDFHTPCIKDFLNFHLFLILLDWRTANQYDLHIRSHNNQLLIPSNHFWQLYLVFIEFL